MKCSGGGHAERPSGWPRAIQWIAGKKGPVKAMSILLRMIRLRPLEGQCRPQIHTLPDEVSFSELYFIRGAHHSLDTYRKVLVMQVSSQN